MLMYLPNRIYDVITLLFDTRFQFCFHCQIWFDVLYTFCYMFCTFNEFLGTPKKRDVMYPTTLTCLKVGQTSILGHNVKKYGTMWKALSQGIRMCNMKALPFGFKVMAKVKVFVYEANADADARAMT